MLYVWPDLSPIQVSSCAVKCPLPCLEISWERANHPDSSASRAKLTGPHLDVTLHASAARLTNLDRILVVRAGMSVEPPSSCLIDHLLGGSGQGHLPNHQVLPQSMLYLVVQKPDTRTARFLTPSTRRAKLHGSTKTAPTGI